MKRLTYTERKDIAGAIEVWFEALRYTLHSVSLGFGQPDAGNMADALICLDQQVAMSCGVETLRWCERHPDFRGAAP